MFDLKYKNEKGSITLYVLVAMLLMISVLTIVYIQINQKNTNQLKELSSIQKELKAIYSNGSMMGSNNSGDLFTLGFKDARIGRDYSYNWSYGLRSVFTLKDTIKVTGGNGTSSSPYTLGT